MGKVVFDVPLSAMRYAPEVYQYKKEGPQALGQGLADVEKWDKEKEGVSLLWRNPEGSIDLINGHNRYQAADRLGQPTLRSFFIEAQTPQQARAIGALANISEGRGDELDAAKVFRDTGITIEELKRQGVPLRENMVRNGWALSRLAPDLFERVVRGDFTKREGIAVGEVLDDPAMQRAALNAVRGRGKSDANVREVARQVRDAGTEDVA